MGWGEHLLWGTVQSEEVFVGEGCVDYWVTDLRAWHKHLEGV